MHSEWSSRGGLPLRSGAAQESCTRWHKAVLRTGLRAILGCMVAVVIAAGAMQGARAADSAAGPAQRRAHPLVWDTTERVIQAQPGDSEASFQFTATNTSGQPVTVESIRPTCGCTLAEMPSSPWVLAPGASGTFTGVIDFKGKQGTVTKALYINSTAGSQVLGVTVKIPQMDEQERRANQAIAQKNRQAVFAGDCAKCHLKPAVNRSGAELFMAACGVCHISAHRSSMVPDLFVARQKRDSEFWRKWISEGKEGTLMPAWSKKHGGPLSDKQIESLVTFATAALPKEPPSE